jgi:hypothetical protein
MTREKLEAETRRQVLDHIARRLAESDARLIASVEAGKLSLDVAVDAMDRIHLDACLSLRAVMRDAVRLLEARRS